jgi:hypothetical protein
MEVGEVEDKKLGCVPGFFIVWEELMLRHPHNPDTNMTLVEFILIEDGDW